MNVEQLIHLDNITINFKVQKDLNLLNIFIQSNNPKTYFNSG